MAQFTSFSRGVLLFAIATPAIFCAAKPLKGLSRLEEQEKPSFESHRNSGSGSEEILELSSFEVKLAKFVHQMIDEHIREQLLASKEVNRNSSENNGGEKSMENQLQSIKSNDQSTERLKKNAELVNGLLAHNFLNRFAHAG